MLSSAVSMAGNIPCLLIGRLLVGTSAGIANVVFGKMITENMPDYYASKFAMFHNASICIGFVLAFTMGALLPDPEDSAANKEDEMWRAIYCVPAIVGAISILLSLTYFRYEPIAFCIGTGRDEEGKKHMARVYRLKDPASPLTITEILDSQFEYQKRSTTMDA